MLNVDDVLEILAIPLLGIIPESPSVLKASNLGMPVTMDEPSIAGTAYRDAVQRLMGEQIEHRVMSPARPGFFQRIFGGRSEARRVGTECVSTSRSRWSSSPYKHNKPTP